MGRVGSVLRRVRVWILGAALCFASTSFVLAATGAVIYTYDALGRVSTASYDTGVIIIYSYDANGNRTQQIMNVNKGTLYWAPSSTPCTANCWGAGLWTATP